MRPVIANARIAEGELGSSRSTAPTSSPSSSSSSTTSRPTDTGWCVSRGPARPHRRSDAPGTGRARRVRGHPVGGRRAAVPARGVRQGRPVGARQVRRARIRRCPSRARRPTAPTPWSARGPAPIRTRPTVLLYAHYDVQPPLDDVAWRTPPFELTEVDGRWYGRGAADCKGNILMHLLALRALGDDVPVNLKLVVEGSEEQGTGGLEAFVASQPGPAARRRDPGLRHRQRRRGPPGRDRDPARDGQRRGHGGGARVRAALRHVRRAGPRRARRTDRHAGITAGPARQHDGHGTGQRRRPGPVPPTRPSSSAPTPACSTACHLLGDGTVSDMLWARPGGHRARHRLPAGDRLDGGDRAAGRGTAEPARPAGHGGRRRPHGVGRPPQGGRALGCPRRRWTSRPSGRRSRRQSAARPLKP